MPQALEAAATALGGLSSALSIAKTMIDLAGSAKQREQAVKLYGEILSAQESALKSQAAQFALVEEKRELERHIADLETWGHEKERYALEKLGSGFAYALKADSAGTEPHHHICAQCYESGKKSILHTRYKEVGRITVSVCPGCKTEFGI